MSENKTRQQWADIPQKLRTKVEDYLGTTVTNTQSQSGGFSPGVACRVYTADARVFFLKAIGTDINPHTINFHRREVIINQHLPENSFAPRLLWSYDDADDTDWIVLLFENADGHNPHQPWQEDELTRVMQALNTLSDTLTPSPIEAGNVPNAEDYFATRIHGWQKIKDATTLQLDDWSQKHLDTLCELEQNAPTAVKGKTLVHFDIRADNIVISDDTAVFVDWPHACIGAAWLDAVAFAPSVAMQSDVTSEALIQQHTACRQADPARITSTVASIAGMLTYSSLQPPPPGIPTLREFQRKLALITRQWLAERTGLA